MLSPVPDDRFVSNGSLPDEQAVAMALRGTHTALADERDGALSVVYPLLAQVDPELFGLSIVTVGGAVHEHGDARAGFTLMSVAKPFVLALVYEQVGYSRVRELVGVNATGMAFNSVAAVERAEGGRTNPMVNSGAIATTSLTPGATVEARWPFLLAGLSRFAGRPLALDSTMLASALSSNHRNRSLAHLLRSLGGLNGEPDDAVELYTRQSCVAVTSVDLAVMGATLADGGVNPVTGERVVGAGTAHDVLAVMTVAGMYETSGDWLLDVGMPAKSGISGGIVCVSPGKGALGVFSPRLDAAGNSVRGQRAAVDLSRRLGMDVLASRPHTSVSPSPEEARRSAGGNPPRTRPR